MKCDAEKLSFIFFFWKRWAVGNYQYFTFILVSHIPGAGQLSMYFDKSWWTCSNTKCRVMSWLLLGPWVISSNLWMEKKRIMLEWKPRNSLFEFFSLLSFLMMIKLARFDIYTYTFLRAYPGAFFFSYHKKREEPNLINGFGQAGQAARLS